MNDKFIQQYSDKLPEDIVNVCPEFVPAAEAAAGAAAGETASAAGRQRAAGAERSGSVKAAGRAARSGSGLTSAMAKVIIAVVCFAVAAAVLIVLKITNDKRSNINDPTVIDSPSSSAFTGTPVPVTETETPPETATDAPATEIPATEVPATEMPATEVPATEVPPTEEPVTEDPTELPATEVPATELPATEVPATEVPATEAPATEAPSTGITFGFSEKHLLPGDVLDLAVYRETSGGRQGDRVEGATFTLIEAGAEEYGTATLYGDTDRLSAWHPGTCTVKATSPDGHETSFRLYVKGINSIKLSSTRVELETGGEAEFTVTVIAIDTEGTYEYSIDRPDVVSFDGRKLKGLSSGLAKITFTTSDGSRTNYCTVQVSTKTNYVPVEDRTAEDIRMHTPGADFKRVGSNNYYSSTAFEGDPGVTYDGTKYKLVRIVVKDDSKRDYSVESHRIPAGLSIVAIDESGNKVNYGYTNGNGAAAMALPVGFYTFELETPADGYLPYLRSNRYYVTDRERFTNVELHVFPESEYAEECVITVRDEQGGPIKGATVYFGDKTDTAVSFVTDKDGKVVMRTPMYYSTGTGYGEVVRLYIEYPGYFPLFPQRIPRSVSSYDAVMISPETVVSLAVAVNELERSVRNGFLWFVEGGDEITVNDGEHNGTYREVMPGFGPDDILEKYLQVLSSEYAAMFEDCEFFAYMKSRYYFDGNKYYYSTSKPKFKTSTESDYYVEKYEVDTEELLNMNINCYPSPNAEYNYRIHVYMKMLPEYGEQLTVWVKSYKFVYENGAWRIGWWYTGTA